MTYKLSLDGWNDGRSCFYNFYNWYITTVSPVGIIEINHPNNIHSVLLQDYNAEIGYVDKVPCIIFKSQDVLTEFVLRWS